MSREGVHAWSPDLAQIKLYREEITLDKSAEVSWV